MIKLYNTLSKNTEDFKPISNKAVSIYSCGPTVYDNVHIGNLCSFIFADTLRRMLLASDYSVRHVMNFTDVDDKTIRNSHQQYSDLEPMKALLKLTQNFGDIFLQDMKAVGNDTNSITFIKATDSIDGMKELILKLYENKIAYLADDGIYFSISAYVSQGRKYGQLLDISIDSTSEERINNDEYDKESVHDFALWKKQKEGEPAWPFTIDSVEMSGRPGWHIECSVMSSESLGQPFDIHTGGVDLIFPHHENEIAQSTATTDSDVYAQFFMHNEHILVDGKKMSKSLKNFYTLRDITDKQFDALALRLLALQAHYRSQAHFTWDNLIAAQNRLKAYQAMAALQWQPIGLNTENAPNEYPVIINKLKAFLQDDLDTPAALAYLSEVSSDFQTALITKPRINGFKDLLASLDAMLGLDLLNVHDISEEQKNMIKLREQARIENNWIEADTLRDSLNKELIGIRDTEYGTIWFPL
jgi:cysteinyl-tRNA synthetase